uniref:GHDTA=GROWTH hormone gene-derived transcriptional activator/hepatic nuclear factor-1 alpha homolog n=1 Tax=Homo sapiens TaxID=9606 RepID=Q9UD04_HUMAN|nr:GHDTA=growth hormone gene-derived transcriptional activator/hepatic nuclear factor-1 alpha homolog [human, pituitary, Peptide, 107 aa] [Homo sapiens]
MIPACVGGASKLSISTSPSVAPCINVHRNRWGQQWERRGQGIKRAHKRPAQGSQGPTPRTTQGPVDSSPSCNGYRLPDVPAPGFWPALPALASRGQCLPNHSLIQAF